MAPATSQIGLSVIIKQFMFNHVAHLTVTPMCSEPFLFKTLLLFIMLSLHAQIYHIILRIIWFPSFRRKQEKLK